MHTSMNNIQIVNHTWIKDFGLLIFQNSTSKLVFENDVYVKFNLTSSFLHFSYECFIAMFIAVLFSSSDSESNSESE